MSPGELLKEARARARLSQTDVARRAGVAQSVISAYEADRREPGILTLTRLIEATGHRLHLVLEPVAAQPQGLPDSPLGRRVRRHRRKIVDLAALRGMRNVRVFGSIARGEDGPDSDVDLLVDVDVGVGLVAIAGLARELAALLGAPVDVVPANALKRSTEAAVLAEAIPL